MWSSFGQCYTRKNYGVFRREDLGKHFLKHILFHPLPFSFFHVPLLIQPEKENWNLKTQKSSCNHNDEGQKGDHNLMHPCLFFSLLSLLIKCTEIKSWGSGEITVVTTDKLSFVWCHMASLLFSSFPGYWFYFSLNLPHIWGVMIQTLSEKRWNKNMKLLLTTTEFSSFILFTDTQSSGQGKEFLSRRKNE